MSNPKPAGHDAIQQDRDVPGTRTDLPLGQDPQDGTPGGGQGYGR